MTTAARAAWGAVLGAILTLLLHPISRAYLLADFRSYRAPGLERWSARISDEKARIAFLLTVYCDSLVNRREDSATLDQAIKAARKGVQLDSQNAYWEQLWAVFLARKGDRAGAFEHWHTASKKIIWNDYQSSFLFAQRFETAEQFHGSMSWQLAYLYFLRSESPAVLISAYGRALVATPVPDVKQNLIIRAVTVRNGDLLREGSKSALIGNYGAQLEEIASHPPGLVAAVNNHRILLARVELYNKLREMGEIGLADTTNRSYRELDAWDALLNPERVEDEITSLSEASVMVAGLPGASLVICVLGALLLGAKLTLFKAKALSPIAIATLACFLSGFAYMCSNLPLVSLAIFGCISFLLYSPKNERTSVSSDLGPLFGLLVGIFSILLLAIVCTLVIFSSFPATAILPKIGVPAEFVGGAGALVGLAILFLSILLFVAPIYGLALRYKTSFVLGILLQKTGKFLLTAGAVGVIVLTPGAILLDKHIHEPLEQMLRNEPVHIYGLPR